MAKEYTPFEKDIKNINELLASDLEILKDIPEGWYIEYKREPCTPKDYAKEISAFANAHGGWMFVGIEEDSSNGKPLGGPGIDFADARKFADSARDAIAQNCSPAPFFELGIIKGSINALSIPDDKCVLVIRVPESENTPHIHCSGRVYLRQADKAEPQEIKERGELDRLYERGEKLHKKRLLRLKSGFDEKWVNEFNAPWFHLALVPDLAHPPNPKVVEFEKFREIVLNSHIKLPDIYPSALGFVARNHSHQQNKSGPATTFEYDSVDGSIFITIPLSYGIAEKPNKFLYHSSIGREMASILKEKGYGQSQIFDGTDLFSCIEGLYFLGCDLLSFAEIGKDYIGRIEMVNLFRYIPYFQSSSYIEWCKNHTFPIVHRSKFNVPLSSDYWFEIDEIQDDSAISSLTYFTFEALGIPFNLVNDILDDRRNDTTSLNAVQN